MNRIDFIVEVIKNSSSFKCGNITYEVSDVKDAVLVRDRDINDNINTFNATELIGTLSSLFSCYLKIENNKIILRIF